MRIIAKSVILNASLWIGLAASSSHAATVINQTYSGSFPATISGTLPNQATVLEEAFTVSSASDLTAFTTSYATGGFEPNLVLYNPDGSFNTITVTPGTSPVAMTDATNGNAFDAYLTASNLTPGTYTLALMDWQVGQSITATNLSDGFTYNSGNGMTFVDEQENVRTGSYGLTIDLTPTSSSTATPEPATLLLTAPLLFGFVIFARRRRTVTGN